jgi:long-chain acyl-CoA synthetase
MSEPERFWLKYMPPEIPADIDSSAYTSIWSMVSEVIQRQPDLPAYHHLGTTISYRQLDYLSQQFAASLQSRFKVVKSDRIALMVPNTLAHPIAMFGILRSGGTVVNINPLLTARELQTQLSDSGARLIVALGICTDALKQILHNTSIEHVIVTEVGDFHPPLRGWLINAYTRYIKGLKPANGYSDNRITQCLRMERESFQKTEIGQDDIAFLQYTGGTTGVAKAAILSHGNMIANTLQAYACIAPAFKSLKPYVITALPLYHIFALTANCLVVIKLGGCSHLITNPRDMGRFIKEIRHVGFHVITGVNTLFNTMLRHADFRGIDFSNLRLTLAGGMSVQDTTAQQWYELTNSAIVEAYGLTEASPAITANPVDSKQYSGTIGMPLPSTEVSIRDDNGVALPLNTTGELWARGPQVMSGYWNRPEETREVLTDDGWLKTGDIAQMDEHGYIRIVDRKKDMIIVSGFNVYPNEVEAVLCNHPGIDEAGVVGISNEGAGETIKAVIIKNNPELTEAEIISYCREQLTAYKVPKVIEFRQTLPKTNVGKILRRELR